MTKNNPFEISWNSLWRVFFMVIIAVIIYLTREVLAILFLSIIISSALDSPVDYLQRKKIPRVIGAFMLLLFILSVLAFLLYIVVPVSIVEFKGIVSNLNEIEIPVFGQINLSEISQKLDEFTSGWADILFSGGASFFNIISRIFGNLVFILSTLIISLYLTINRDGVENFLKLVLPINIENYVVDIYIRSRRKLALWLQGQLVAMLIVGVITLIGLLLLGVKYSLVLSLLAGFFEIVPIVGPIFAGILAFLIAISQSWTLGLYVIILFIIIQQIENHLLIPFLMKKAVGISPVLVVIALLAGSQLTGFIGVILAVPTAVIIQEAIEDWSRIKQKRLKSNEE